MVAKKSPTCYGGQEVFYIFVGHEVLYAIVTRRYSSCKGGQEFITRVMSKRFSTCLYAYDIFHMQRWPEISFLSSWPRSLLPVLLGRDLLPKVVARNSPVCQMAKSFLTALGGQEIFLPELVVKRSLLAQLSLISPTCHGGHELPSVVVVYGESLVRAGGSAVDSAPVQDHLHKQDAQLEIFKKLLIFRHNSHSTVTAHG